MRIRVPHGSPDFNNKMNEFEKDFKEFFRIKKDIKEDFAMYINDKSIPLDKRWDIFGQSEGLFSSTNGYIYHGLDFVSKQVLSYDGNIRPEPWIYLEDYERYRTINLLDIVDIFEGYAEDINNGNFGHNNFLQGFTCFTEPDIMIRVKEQILKDNIWSFEYDW